MSATHSTGRTYQSLLITSLPFGATPGQVALAWLLAQKPWIGPIPGTRKLARLEENSAAAYLNLSGHDLLKIDRTASAISVQGARLPQAVLKLTNG